DVAIRELVQNSIDSCKLKEAEEKGFKGKIIIRRITKNELIVEDNGLGMDYIEAKSFLSSIGDSFYDPETFKEKWAGTDYSPISRFGIGILSSFLIADGVEIETLKIGKEACKFSIGSVNEEWKYEKGSRNEPGTSIILKLNDIGQKIGIEESLNRYFLCPELPIEYTDFDDIRKVFRSEWNYQTIIERFLETETDLPIKDIAEEVLNLEKPEYDLIACRSGYDIDKELIIFNHGIILDNIWTSWLNISSQVFINLKRDLVDINLSRESIKQNKKWMDLQCSVISDIFILLNRKYGGNNPEGLISYLFQLFNFPWDYENDKVYERTGNDPIQMSLIEQAPYLIFKNGNLSLIKWQQILDYKEINIYNPCSKRSIEEMENEIRLANSCLNLDFLIINPYQRLYKITKQNNGNNKTLWQYLLDKKRIEYNQFDLGSALLDVAKEVDVDYNELIPENVKFATFTHGLHPIVIVREPIIVPRDLKYVETSNIYLRLFREFFEKELVDSYIHMYKKSSDIYNSTIIKDISVYIDISDTFVKSIFEKRKYSKFEKELSDNVWKYFKFLSILPYILHQDEILFIFLGILDSIEANIANNLNIERSIPLLDRFKPSYELFLNYYRRKEIIIRD
ncbi:MAG: ATP-binding protein, partial [Candidatus Hermodarchaeota archaeon]